MPKMKSNSGAKKRFHRTASGKFKRHKAFRSHILSSKSSKRKRHLRKAVMASTPDQRHIAMLVHK